jgi:glycerol-3-phosphate acyltransferase PlsY
MPVLLMLVAALASYFVGSIPMGWVWVKLFTGQDVRTIGSGRTGGTNALRAAGRVAGALTSVGDFFKGLAGVWLARWLVPDTLYPQFAPWAQALSGLAAVAGHNWSIYIGFKGGAGTGPNVGVAAGFYFPTVLALAPLVPITLILTGYASVTSIVIGALIVLFYVLAAVLWSWPWAYAVYGAAAFLLVLWALRPNLQRLMNGTERMVGPRARRRQAAGDTTPAADRDASSR